MATKKKNIPDSSEEFLTFFKTEVERIEEEITRISEMQEKLATFTKSFEHNVTTRGASHYYIESIKNELQASSQKQSLIRDMRDLRKMALDYSMRMTGEDGDTSFAALQRKLIEMTSLIRVLDKDSKTEENLDGDAYDELIEKRLKENK